MWGTMGAAPLAKGCSYPTAAALGLFLAGSSCPNPNVPRNGAGGRGKTGRKRAAETRNAAAWASVASCSVNRLHNARRQLWSVSRGARERISLF